VTTLLLFVLLLVLAAEFVNGWHDASNAIATVVSTRVLSPRVAIVMATVFNAVGALSGTAVAATIGKGIVDANAINLVTVASAMVAIVVWDVLTWYYGLPTSSSHALVAGLSGAGLAAAGPSVLLWDGWRKVLIGLLFSTFLGFFGGALLIWSIVSVCRSWSPGRVRRVFGRLQVFSAVFMAFSHGSNDGQKFIGVFTLALVLGGVLPEFHPSFGVVLLCSITMGLGTSVGGWRIIRTMGMKIAHLEPYHGFAAETAAGTAIELASRLGIPLSTTHTWGVVGDVVTAWILTFPVCGVIGWLVAVILAKLA
jgi:PiT family inorganic phosphate transporter